MYTYIYVDIHHTYICMYGLYMQTCIQTCIVCTYVYIYVYMCQVYDMTHVYVCSMRHETHSFNHIFHTYIYTCTI